MRNLFSECADWNDCDVLCKRQCAFREAEYCSIAKRNAKLCDITNCLCAGIREAV